MSQTRPSLAHVPFVVVALALSACDKDDARSDPAPTASAIAATAPSASAQTAPSASVAASAEPEQPKAADLHDGQVQATRAGKMRLALTPDGVFRVWLHDRDGTTLRSVHGATGRIKITVPGYPDVLLQELGDHLEGRGASVREQAHAKALVTVQLAKQRETSLFTLHAETVSQGGHHHAK